MVIDFHTHVFPEKIASHTLEVLKRGIAKQQGEEYPAYTDATPSGLRASMRKNGIDLSVVMPIATKPRQTETINRYAKEITAEGLISFGSVHPAQPDAEDVLSSLAEQGFCGIKLHPEFQDFYIDSPESLKILKKAEELGLLVTVHAGKDVGMPPPVHCTPERLKNILGEIRGDRLIAAHLGGFGMWEDVERYLVGTPIYMDTAVVGGIIEPAVYRRIIENHGADRVLFATDSPWEDQGEALAALRSLGLSAQDYAKVTCENACALLGINGTIQHRA